MSNGNGLGTRQTVQVTAEMSVRITFDPRIPLSPEEQEMIDRFRGLAISARQAKQLPDPQMEELTRALALSAAPVSLRDAEDAHILSTLRTCSGSMSRTARTLGISRKGLYNRLGEIKARPVNP